MKSVRPILALAISLPVLLVAIASHSEDKAPAPKKKILVLTFSAGFVHSSLAMAEQVVKHMGETSGLYEAECLGLYKQRNKVDLSFLTKDYLDQFDAVFLYTTTGERELDLLTDEQKKAFADYIHSGRGAFIGSHSASDTFYQWPEYNEIAGAYSINHPWGADSSPVTIKVEDPNHPATQMLRR